MKVLLEVDDKKAPFFMEVLKNFSFVKATKVSPQKALLIKEIRETVDNVNLYKRGKLKARPAKELLDEL